MKIQMKKELLNALGISVSKDLSPRELLSLSNDELFNSDTADKVAALKEICEELYGKSIDNNQKIISNSLDAAIVLAQELRFLDHEECWIVTVNANNAVIRKHHVGTGSLRACIIDIRRITKTALIDNCSGVIIAHNHPSGSTDPSKADLEETKRLRDALALFDIKLLDHLIVTDDKFYSFSDESTSLFAINKV